MDNLYKIGEWVEHNKQIIVDEWLEDINITTILKKHKVSLNKFSTNFAIKILEYSINVMKAKEEIGNCPVMNKFVDYMIKHKIKSVEILQICTPLRSTLLLNLFKSYPNFASDLSSIKKILKIFDANLAGVLHNYDELQHKISSFTEQRNLTLKTYLNRLQIILNTQENIIFKLNDGEIFIGNRALYRTAGVDGLEKFKEKYPQPLSFIKSANCYNTVFQDQNYVEWINLILQHHQGQCKIKLFNNIENKTSLMNMKITKIGDKNDYVFSIQELTELHNKKIKYEEVGNVDTLTNLHNLKGFEELLERKLKDTDHHNLKILMIELHGLSLYNETNSEEEADTVVKNVANTLKNQYGDDVARIDYDRFVILNNNLTLDVSNEIVKELESIISSSPNTEELSVNAAVVLLEDSDTINNVIHHGEMLLNHLKAKGSQNVVDDTALTQAETKRLKDEKKFLTLMKEYKIDKKTLPVTNYYLEIPLKSDAKILNISEKEMTLSVRKISAVALHKHDHIYIAMPAKPNYRATIKEVNIEKNQIILERFEAMESSALDRKNIHVKLSDPLEVLVKSGKVQILEGLESASIDAFVILVNHLYNIEKDSKLDIFATLINEKEEEFKGVVFKIIPIADKFKLIIHLEPTKSIQNSLVPFISQRQIEIIKELQDKTSY